MKRQTLSVNRPTQNQIEADGTISLGTPTVIEIKASVQPADREQMEANPELRDYKQAYTLYSNTELYTSDASVTEADIVSIYGKDFEVVTTEVWANKIRNHFKIMVAR